MKTKIIPREAANLMKRLEASSKEEMKLLIKKHKDKNELDRIKRELQQKMIGEAVAERQKVILPAYTFTFPTPTFHTPLKHRSVKKSLVCEALREKPREREGGRGQVRTEEKPRFHARRVSSFAEGERYEGRSSDRSMVDVRCCEAGRSGCFGFCIFFPFKVLFPF